MKILQTYFVSIINHRLNSSLGKQFRLVFILASSTQAFHHCLQYCKTQSCIYLCKLCQKYQYNRLCMTRQASKIIDRWWCVRNAFYIVGTAYTKTEIKSGMHRKNDICILLPKLFTWQSYQSNAQLLLLLLLY